MWDSWIVQMKAIISVVVDYAVSMDEDKLILSDYQVNVLYLDYDIDSVEKGA